MKLILRCLWRGLGVGFRDHLGSKIGVSGHLGTSWSALGASWRESWSVLERLEHLGSSLERLGARLGGRVPFSPEPKGLERQVRGSLPVASARGVVGTLHRPVWPSSPPKTLLAAHSSLLIPSDHCSGLSLPLIDCPQALFPLKSSLPVDFWCLPEVPNPSKPCWGLHGAQNLQKSSFPS